MKICVVGVNYRTTPNTVRGKLAIGASHLHEALLSLREYIAQGIVLCTCNRTEVYSVSQDDSAEVRILDFLQDRSGLSRPRLLKHVYTYHDEAAVEHLFRVASGLDSMIVGEFEILGQVRRALEEAEKAHFVELPLRNLFRSAIRTGRQVRAHTGLSRNALSVSSVAVTLAASIVGDISSRRIVVIGAGEAGQMAAKAGHDQGASHIVVVSRSKKKGKGLASRLDGTWSPMEKLPDELTACDVAICCSGAPHTILKLDLVEKVINSRPEQPLVIIDIAVPPDVESQVRQLGNVFLYDIDDLVNVSDANRRLREEEIHGATGILEDEVNKFLRYWRELDVKPVVSALVNRSEEIRRAKLNMTLRKLPNLTEEERSYLEAMTKAIVKQILHEPIRSLKNNNHKSNGHLETVKELFSLDEKK